MRRRAEPNNECVTCGKSFHTKPSSVSRRKNCSWVCRIKYRKTLIGPLNGNWKGGWLQQGYLCQGEGKKQRYQHRKIMEEKLGRILRETEIVHHVDGNKLNNEISNLQVVTRAEHARIHYHEREVGDDGRLL